MYRLSKILQVYALLDHSSWQGPPTQQREISPRFLCGKEDAKKCIVQGVIHMVVSSWNKLQALGIIFRVGST
jgi:hypothetical protein